MNTSPTPDTLDARDRVTVSEEIAAPNDVVFDLLTDPAELEEWLRAPDGSSTRDWTIELIPGGSWRATIGPDADPRELHGEVVEVDRPNALELTWFGDGWNAGGSRVRFTLAPLAVGDEEWTRLTVTHTMCATPQGPKIALASRWEGALQELASLVSRLIAVATR